MQLENYYYYFQGVLTPRFCNDVLEYGKKHQNQIGLTGKVGQNRDLKTNPLTKKEIKNLQKIRNSEYCLDGMTNGFIKKLFLMLMKQIKKQIGILIGIGQNPVNLQNILLVNIMVGIVISYKHLIIILI
jgi:hypothetical protein